MAAAVGYGPYPLPLRLILPAPAMSLSSNRDQGGQPGCGAGMVFTLFTNDPALAGRADAAGVDRIGLDLEAMGKSERQGHTPSWISHHRIDQLPAIAGRLDAAVLFARTNPIHAGSAAEVDALVAAGAAVLMLPMFRTCAEVETFVRLVDGRAEVSLLAETAASLARLHEIVRVPGIGEIHIGLNDMHLDMKLASHFEVLASDVMDVAAETVHRAGLPFGFGGVGRHGDTRLPIPADLVYAQLARLAASRTLISRVFVDESDGVVALDQEVLRVRERLDYWSRQPPQDLLAARDDLRRRVRSRYG